MECLTIIAGMQNRKDTLLLRVSYRVPSYHIAEYERIFQQQVVPLAAEKGLRLVGIWKSLVGDVGEFFELWEFSSLTEFEIKWPSLLEDSRFQELLRTTGPMVKDESFSLFQPILSKPGLPDGRRLV